MVKRLWLFVLTLSTGWGAIAQQQIKVQFRNQYELPLESIKVFQGGSENSYTADADGFAVLSVVPGDSVTFSHPDYKPVTLPATEIKDNGKVVLHKKFTWKDLLNPMFYIIYGGLWLLLFIVFAETGLFAGFFLPGDSLLFVAGIYSHELITKGLGVSLGSDFLHLLVLTILVSIAGILGNFVGYWFGAKSGPFLFKRKDTALFKKKHLYAAKEFYDKHGGTAIVFARFLPIIRTFAPIIAGIVGMDKKKFSYYNFVGCIAWATSMLFAGHYLYQFFLKQLDFDLKEHLEIIVIGIIVVTTAPVLYKLFFGKRGASEKDTVQNS
ncbi:MAG: VTT domain-containing protein [Chitinophagaceae bacterium]|nr:VTT domain-containing protein [Chitinophagaceae bacterium]